MSHRRYSGVMHRTTVQHEARLAREEREAKMPIEGSAVCKFAGCKKSFTGPRKAQKLGAHNWAVHVRPNRAKEALPLIGDLPTSTPSMSASADMAAMHSVLQGFFRLSVPAREYIRSHIAR
jgi:hypothetical protein